jgi:trehalose/maltose transport system substrate-binding protein
MNRYRWCIPALVLMCAACGGGPKPEPVRLTVFGVGLQVGEQLRTDALDEFTRETGVEVDLIPTLGTSTEQLKLALKLLRRGVAAPDLYVMDVIWPGMMHEHLLDLTGYANGETQRHAPALIENNTAQGRVVGLPFYMNAGMLFYRADLLKKYGYKAPPSTWGELDRIAKRIQQGERKEGRKQFWGYVWQGGAYEGLTCNALEWLRSFGGGHIIEAGGEISVNNRRAAEALQIAANRINSISPSSVLSYTESDALNVFQSGGAAFMRHWSSAFQSINNSMPPGSVGVALLPAGPAERAHTIGGFQLGVSRYSRHSRQAASLALYLTGADVQKRRALRRGYMPTRPELYEDPDLVKALPPLGVLQKARPESWVLRPSTASRHKYAEVSQLFYETVHNVLAGNQKAAPALAGLERDLIRLTGARGTRPD